MRTVTVTRIPEESGDQGTFGKLVTDSGFSCYTGELPDRGNSCGKSCIPVGTYVCRKRFSEKHQRQVYGVDEVPGRTDVEVHSGNFCGDVDLGFKSDVLGCLLLGRAITEIAGQRALMNSRDALAGFEADLADEAAFTLTIK